MSLVSAPRLTTLPNGVRVVTEHMASVASVSLGVWIAVGARVESEREHGIAHLLEHMAFKGTRRRSAQAIAEEIESVGGEINAMTGMESTTYYTRTLSADADLGLDILADILTDSVLSKEELAREKGVIRQEIAAMLDTPDDVVFEHLGAASFEGHALGRSILGTDTTVQAMKRDDLRRFMDTHYLGPQLIVAAAGDVEHERFVEQAERYFGALRRGDPAPEIPAAFTGAEIRDERETEQVVVAVALPGPSLRDPDVHAARIFANVAGGGMSSRLFQEVREKRGLCYSIAAYHTGHSDVGSYGLFAGTAPEDVAELVPVMMAEVARAAEDVTEVEIARAKAQFKASMLMGLENSFSRADRHARQLMVFGALRGLDEVTAKIDAVTLADVRRAGRAAIADGRVAMATVGPTRGLDRIDAIAKTVR